MPNWGTAIGNLMIDSFRWFLWKLCGDSPFPNVEEFDLPDCMVVKPQVSLPAKVIGYSLKMVFNLLASAWTVFIGYLIFFHPYSMHPHVDNATIVAFDLINNTSLRYELSTNVTFFNEHRIFGIRFNHLTAGLYFKDTKLGPSDDMLPRFKLHTRRHKRVHTVLRGKANNISTAMADEFTRELAAGTFSVDMKLKTTMTYIYWPTKAVYYYVFDCWLHFPAPPNNNRTALVIDGVKCRSSKSN